LYDRLASSTRRSSTGVVSLADLAVLLVLALRLDLLEVPPDPSEVSDTVDIPSSASESMPASVYLARSSPWAIRPL
jgi:hypothetical protein